MDERAGAYVWSWCCDVTITSLWTRELVPMSGHGVVTRNTSLRTRELVPMFGHGVVT